MFGEMGRSTIRRIGRFIQPIRFEEHRQYRSDVTRVGIEGQVNTYEVMPRLKSRRPPTGGFQSFRMLDLHTNSGAKRSRFLSRNVGISFQAYSRAMRREREVEGISLDVGVSDAEVIRTLADNPGVLSAIEVCASGAMPTRFKSFMDEDAAIFYGDDPLTFRDFWNEPLFRGNYFGSQNSIRSFWMPTNFFSDPDLWNALVHFLKRRVSSRFSGLTAISFFSRTHDDEELGSLATRLRTDSGGSLQTGTARRVTDSDFEPIIEPRTEELGGFDQHHYVAGSALHLEVTTPEMIASEQQNGCFLADLWIEDPMQERTYVSDSSPPWWCLPKRNGVARLFAVDQPARVNREHHLSVELTQQTRAIFIRIPSHDRVVEKALQNEGHAMMLTDLRKRILPTAHDLWFRLSDKGKYFNGVLGLLGGTEPAYLFFDHPLWMRFATNLSSRSPGSQLIAQVIKRLQSLRSRITVSETDALHFIEHVAKQMPRERLSVNFAEVRGWANAELTKLGMEKRRDFLEDWGEVRGVQGLDESAMLNRYLTDALSELLAKKVCFQGGMLTCESCQVKLWYDLPQLLPQVICRGCREIINVPAELEWSYTLNELVRAAVGDHGVVPVIRCLARVLHEMPQTFYYAAGLGVMESWPGQSVTDLDLVWVRNGLLGLAEVKTTSRSFGLAEHRDFVRLVELFGPDEAMVVFSEGDDDVSDIEAKLKEDLAGCDTHVTVMSPSLFRKPVIAIPWPR